MGSYVAKKNKGAVVLATNHYTAEGPKMKPALILDYKNKSGVDNMDKCLAEYTTNRLIDGI